MSDDLRTRIAAALKSTYGKTQSWEEMADAVIEALALKREHLSGRDSLYAIAGDPRPIHRYVTEWTADE